MLETDFMDHQWACYRRITSFNLKVKTKTKLDTLVLYAIASVDLLIATKKRLT
jgi:hypothetical protein